MFDTNNIIMPRFRRLLNLTEISGLPMDRIIGLREVRHQPRKSEIVELEVLDAKDRPQNISIVC